MQTYSRSVYITLFEILPIWACFFSNSNKFNVFILFIELVQYITTGHIQYITWAHNVSNSLFFLFHHCSDVASWMAIGL